MQHAKLIYLTEADYLQGEESSHIRHEYVAGQTFAMAGASKTHNVVSLNIVERIRSHLRGTSCRTYMADMKVRIEHAEGVSHYYPDVVVTCSPRDNDPTAPSHYLNDPVFIVEVLSPATESSDRREKMLAYGRLPSLKEYLLVDSQNQRVEVYRKNELGGWDVEIPAGEESVTLTSIGLAMPVAEMYQDTDLQ